MSQLNRLQLYIILVKSTRNGNNGGFGITLVDRKFSDFEKDIIICSACDGILREPVLVGNIFKCKFCLEPGDVATDSKISIVPLTSRLQIVCPFKKEGCTWNGPIAKLIEHRNIVRYFYKNTQIVQILILRVITSDMDVRL